MSNVSSEDYTEIAFAIAAVLYAISDREPDGTLPYCHFNENNLQAPCDMLARLGVMTGDPSDVAHGFARGWTPWSPVAPIRHDGAPHSDDLLLAVAFYIEWFPDDVVRVPFDAAAPMPHIPALTAPNQVSEARQWAMHRIVAVALRQDLGRWTDNGFRLHGHDAAVGESLEPYWDRRHRDAQRLGGEMALYPSV